MKTAGCAAGGKGGIGRKGVPDGNIGANGYTKGGVAGADIAGADDAYAFTTQGTAGKSGVVAKLAAPLPRSAYVRSVFPGLMALYHGGGKLGNSTQPAKRKGQAVLGHGLAPV